MYKLMKDLQVSLTLLRLLLMVLKMMVFPNFPKRVSLRIPRIADPRFMRELLSVSTLLGPVLLYSEEIVSF